MSAVLDIRGLSVELRTRAGDVEPVDSVDLSIGPGETVCLVGESGSGKTVSALSVTRLIDFKGGVITKGVIGFGRQDLAALSQKEMTHLRGRRIGFVFQEPTTSFDPLLSIGAQLIEALVRHGGLNSGSARAKAIELLRRVQISDPERRIDQFPHELSGGMRQRVMIAIALSCDPVLLIADEPTTALDVTIQAQILHLLKSIQAETKMAMLLITHDLGVAASLADRVVVMYAGRVVENAPASTLFSNPQHPYTRGLLRSVVGLNHARHEPLYSIRGSIPGFASLPTGCRFHPRCERASPQCTQTSPALEARGEGLVACFDPDSSPIESRAQISVETRTERPAAEALPLVRGIELVKHYTIGRKWPRRSGTVIRAVDHVSLDILTGETFGLVGESGSGKSTLGRLLLHLEPATKGKVEFDGRDLAALSARALRAERRHMQMIFQDPYGSLDPRWSIGRTIAEPLVLHEQLSPALQRDKVRSLLDQVGLEPDWETRYAHQLSGGQRQRVAIARAIAANPRFIVADEAVSALDVSVRAQIVNLMLDIKARLGVTYLFIGHELNLVRRVSDRIGVMYQGKLVELGPADDLFHHPAHHYTRALVAAIPDPSPRGSVTAPLEGEIPSVTEQVRGCSFAGRCRAATAHCREETPALVALGNGRAVACHYPL